MHQRLRKTGIVINKDAFKHFKNIIERGSHETGVVVRVNGVGEVILLRMSDLKTALNDYNLKHVESNLWRCTRDEYFTL